jgi:uncharacterized sulfatase
LDGIDQRPVLDDPSRATKDAAYTMTTRDDSPAKDHSKVMSFQGRSVRTDRWRYTEWDGGKRGSELYDHENDPNEWRNLANEPEYAGTVEQMKQLLAAEKQRAPAVAP